MTIRSSAYCALSIWPAVLLAFQALSRQASSHLRQLYVVGVRASPGAWLASSEHHLHFQFTTTISPCSMCHPEGLSCQKTLLPGTRSNGYTSLGQVCGQQMPLKSMPAVLSRLCCLQLLSCAASMGRCSLRMQVLQEAF